VLYTAHVGDSGAIIDRGGTAYRLTEDHKPYMKAERQRIQEAGGQLVENGNRVLSNAKDDGRASMLAMSRCHQLSVSIMLKHQAIWFVLRMSHVKVCHVSCKPMLQSLTTKHRQALT